MNSNFRSAVNFYKPVVNLSHKTDVIRLYRKMLRTVGSWCEDREVFCTETEKIRKQFDAHKNLPEGK